MLEQLTVQHPPFGSGGLGMVVEEIQVLQGRLERGWDVISVAEQHGQPTEGLYGHFLELLHQYESLCDQLLNS